MHVYIFEPQIFYKRIKIRATFMIKTYIFETSYSRIIRSCFTMQTFCYPVDTDKCVFLYQIILRASRHMLSCFPIIAKNVKV